MDLPASHHRRPRRDWPRSVPDAPQELVDLIAAAMVDFGPDAHSDGAEIIAALAMQWVRDAYMPTADYNTEF